MSLSAGAGERWQESIPLFIECDPYCVEREHGGALIKKNKKNADNQDNPDKIEHPHLILCEGIDAKKFLIKYLNSDALKEDSFFSKDIEVLNFGGNENLLNYLEPLKSVEGYSNVVSLLIVRDAEQDAQQAAREIQKALQFNSLHVPKELGKWSEGVPKTCFLLFPKFVTKECGTLEDLCVKMLNNTTMKTLLEEIEVFIKHLEKRGQTFSHRHKTKLHTYFSVNNKFVSMKLGEAAWAGAFDWSSSELEPLKKCLKEMKQGSLKSK